MNRADVVVVGGGVMGASVAHHLAERGVRDILVLDRGPAPGAGSTGRATGGFRAQYGTAINVRLSLLARRKLLAFRDEVGADPGYHQAGYLWLSANAREQDILREGLAVQHAEGLAEAREVTPDEALRLNPALASADIAGGVFCPTDGFIRPLQILEGYLSSARRRGVRVDWDTTVSALERGPDGRITGVVTGRGTIGAGAVVNAAGAWAARLAEMAGVTLPVEPLRRQVAATVPCELLPASMPMTIFAGDGYHLRVRDGRVLLLWPTPGVVGAPFDTRVDDDWVAEVLRKTAARVPALREVPVDRAASWAGLYEMSPDKHAILGPAPGCPNLYLVNGSSGHGVMHSPALGQLLAEIICDGRASTLDVSALSPARFAEGRLNKVSELL
ncbi:MAG TPA: FAD-binding oxidoreductase [Gemmatimonadales bacterium]|nr:FAD-binding oxidoreductase [Gemmatimonadales bacterium]